MLRTILAVIAGVIVGGVVVALVEGLGHLVFPPPVDVDLKDPEVLKAMMHEIPMGAKVAVLVAWALGVFAGGATAKIIGKTSGAVWGVAGVFALFCGAVLLSGPHPAWMIPGAVVALVLGAGAANGMIKARG